MAHAASRFVQPERILATPARSPSYTAVKISCCRRDGLPEFPCRRTVRMTSRHPHSAAASWYMITFMRWEMIVRRIAAVFVLSALGGVVFAQTDQQANNYSPTKVTR